jgi:hypothetical protein
MKIRGRVLGGGRPVRSDQDLSPDALAEQLAVLQTSQSELAHTIDLLASQIDALRENGSEEPIPSTLAPSEPQGDSEPNLNPPPPPPPGFAVDTPISSSATPPPPPPPPGPGNQPRFAPPPPPPLGMGHEPASPPPPPGTPASSTVVSPPPPSAGPTLSPLDRLLGEDFGKPRVASSIEAQPAPTTPNLPASDISSQEPDTSPGPEPTFRVAPIGDDKEPERPEEVESPSPVTPTNSPSPTATEPASPFSFKAKLDQLNGDEPGSNGQVSAPSPPSPTEEAKAIVGAKTDGAVPSSAVDEPVVTDNLPAPDFFRSGGQSFASAAAMVNDILEATPDTPPEPGTTQAEESADQPGDAPRAPDVPITPDFFTAQPKKKLFRLRR